MMQIRYWAILGGLTLALNAGSAYAAVFHPKTKTLENGLQVVVVENHRAPIVTHMMWVKVGAADETPGRSGLAHYLEHLMFKSTANRAAGVYSREIAKLGGDENAFTSSDFTAYYATVSNENLPRVMELEADRFANLQFKPEEATPELAVVIDEKRQRVDSDPYAIFGQQMASALHPSHPYGRPVIGWEYEIERLTAQDAEQFYKVWYRPGNAILIVSGDVQAEKIFALAQKYYGNWKGEALPPRERPRDPDFTGKVRIDGSDARVKETLVQVNRKLPSRRQDAAMADALEVLQQMMAGSEASYLSRTLVQEKKLASSVSMNYDADQYDAATLGMGLIPKEGVTPEALLEGLRVALEAYAAAPVDIKALDDAKKSLQRKAILARDSVVGPAYAFGIALTTGQTIDNVEKWPDGIAAVTPEAVANALKVILVTPTVTGVVTPAAGAPDIAKVAPPVGGMGTGELK